MTEMADGVEVTDLAEAVVEEAEDDEMTLMTKILLEWAAILRESSGLVKRPHATPLARAEATILEVREEVEVLVVTEVTEVASVDDQAVALVAEVVDEVAAASVVEEEVEVDSVVETAVTEEAIEATEVTGAKEATDTNFSFGHI